MGNQQNLMISPASLKRKRRKVPCVWTDDWGGLGEPRDSSRNRWVEWHNANLTYHKPWKSTPDQGWRETLNCLIWYWIEWDYRFLQAHRIQSWNPIRKTRVHVSFTFKFVAWETHPLYLRTSNVSYLNVPKPLKLLVNQISITCTAGNQLSLADGFQDSWS